MFRLSNASYMTSLYDALESEIYILQHDKAGVAEVYCDCCHLYARTQKHRKSSNWKVPPKNVYKSLVSDFIGGTLTCHKIHPGLVL